MSVLVIRTGGLGDCLLTLPVIHRIMYDHDGVSVEILGNAMMREVAGLAGWIDACHDLDDSRFARLYGDAPLTDDLIRFFTPFTHVYCFSATPEPERLIERIHAAGAEYCAVVDPRPPDRFTGHMLDHLMSILPETMDMVYPVDTPHPLIKTIIAQPEPCGLLMHPGSGSMSKNWPLERFCAIADMWDGDVTCILGPAEIERGFHERLADTDVRIVTPNTVSELAGYIAGAAVFLGNDSGSAHLAGLLGIPSVVLFGPSDPVRWRPVGCVCVALRGHDRTLAGISVDDVIATLLTVADVQN